MKDFQQSMKMENLDFSIQNQREQLISIRKKGIWYANVDLDCDLGVLVDKNSLPQDLKTLKWEDSPVILQEI